jgi:hypothetical protein
VHPDERAPRLPPANDSAGGWYAPPGARSGVCELRNVRHLVLLLVLVTAGALAVTAKLAASPPATYWAPIERVKYSTNQSAFVRTTITTGDVFIYPDARGTRRGRVRLKVKSPSRTISAIEISGDVTCDRNSYRLTTKSKRFSGTLRPGQTAQLPEPWGLQMSLCSWSLSAVGTPTRTNVTHRMTLEISATSLVSGLVPSGPGGYYHREECTIFEGSNSTSRHCRQLGAVP